MSSDYRRLIEGFANRAALAQKAVQEHLPTSRTREIVPRSPSDEQEPVQRLGADPLYVALSDVSPALASSYAQIRIDLRDTSRQSWAGTAHEIREVVATLLRTLAPDSEVSQRPWYRVEPNTNGPTHRQRARFILEQHSAGSKQRAVVEEISVLDEMVGELVRATYTRASDAAHRMKGRSEARRVFRYFEAFAYDLLNL